MKVVRKKVGAAAEGGDDGNGHEEVGTFKVSPTPEDVDDLRVKVKEKMPNELASVDAVRLTVYKPNQNLPNNDVTELTQDELNNKYIQMEVDASIPTGTTAKQPLVVLASGSGKRDHRPVVSDIYFSSLSLLCAFSLVLRS